MADRKKGITVVAVAFVAARNTAVAGVVVEGTSQAAIGTSVAVDHTSSAPTGHKQATACIVAITCTVVTAARGIIAVAEGMNTDQHMARFSKIRPYHL